MDKQRRARAGQLVSPAARQVPAAAAGWLILDHDGGQGRRRMPWRLVHHSKHAVDVARMRLAEGACQRFPFVPCHGGKVSQRQRIDRQLPVAYGLPMGKTKQARETMYLAPEKLDALKALAARTRIARAELIREAIDDLLVKHKAKAPKRRVRE